MRNLLKSFMCVAILIVASLGVVACDKEGDPSTPAPQPVALTIDMVSLQYSSVAYDGIAKEPTVTVTVNQTAVADTEYTVAYTNNTNAGTANVEVTAATGSTVISGTISKTFTIEKGTTIANSYETLVSALANVNYNKVNVSNDIVVSAGQTLTIPQGVEVVFDGVALENNGTLVNQGTLKAVVSTRDALVDAFNWSNYIVLSADIVKIDQTCDDIDVNATDKDYNFTLDLNGYDIESELNFRTWGYHEGAYKYFDYSIDVNIINSNTEVKSTIGRSEPHCYYGLMVNGNENIKVSVENVKFIGYYAGVYTNGTCNLDGEFSATNCEFVCGGESGGGAYMAANYTYTLTNCRFEGDTAYYTKSGTHTLTNCEFVSDKEYSAPQYHGSAAIPTGSAIVVDSCVGSYGQELDVTIVGGTITSAYGYGIEEVSTAAAGVTLVNYATVEVSGVEHVECPLGEHLENVVEAE